MSPGLVAGEAERPRGERDLICNFIKLSFPTLLLGLPAPLGAGLLGFLGLPGSFWVVPLGVEPEMLLWDPGCQGGGVGKDALVANVQKSACENK